MKVTVTKYLNVRVGSPSVNAPCYQYLAPGSEIEVDGQMYKGDLYDGTDLWMKDAAGNYYWAGGMSEAAVTQDPANEAAPDFNYNQLIQNIPTSWRNTKGQGVKVVIMDSGVSNNHKDITIDASSYFDFYYDGSDKYDKLGHGTKVAGIIGGVAAGKGITGISPKCEMISYKTISNEGDTERLSIKNAMPTLLALAASNKAVLVNCSWNLNGTAEMDDIFNNAPENIIFFCAAGNNLKLIPPASLNYPASLKRMISVGYDSESIDLSKLDVTLNYIFLGSSIKSCYIPEKAQYDDFTDCSMATAICTGIAALLVSFLISSGSQPITTDLIRQQLSGALPIAPTTFIDSLNLYRTK